MLSRKPDKKVVLLALSALEGVRKPLGSWLVAWEGELLSGLNEFRGCVGLPHASCLGAWSSLSLSEVGPPLNS